MRKPLRPVASTGERDAADLDWRKTRALEMAHKKAAGVPVLKIARFYRVRRSVVFSEIRSIPAEIRARIETLVDETT